ncbi:DUF481 domain-containing protein [uncultured Algibacter sp.]|uniref:DUF481 domain-containing protein n=1 Tax=uncultured Algibacter sp. TaxID=298659 RepID=UPI00262464C9|nr:DUF481 domain-containing protein [uncultured Algibacter sp.]
MTILHFIAAFFLKQHKVACLFFIVFPLIGLSQNDSIQLKDQTILVGEIKSLARGVLVIKTSFSDSDFHVEFKKVESLSIERKCLVLLTQNRRRYGFVQTTKPGYFTLTLPDGIEEQYRINEITSLDEIYDKFWDRFKGSFDLGFNFTKANSFTQLSIGSELSYIDQKSVITGTLDALSTGQDETIDTRRTDANIEFLRLLGKSWYLMSSVAFLSNTEQALDARISPSLGAGRFLISTNQLYYGVSLGFTYNIENYVDKALNKTSTEAFIFNNFNIFDMKDFDLTSSLNIFPSLSEKGRLRTDFNVTSKYKIISDFYIKIGFTLNYDNQPAVEGNEIDYNFTSGLGWKFNK